MYYQKIVGIANYFETCFVRERNTEYLEQWKLSGKAANIINKLKLSLFAKFFEHLLRKFCKANMLLLYRAKRADVQWVSDSA
jgi:hypothetical protein